MLANSSIRVSLLVMVLALLSACSSYFTVTEQQHQRQSAMADLQEAVSVFTADLTAGVEPAGVYVSWYDNLQPSAPMLADAYVASMVEAELIKRGFKVYRNDDLARYRLQLIMTPGSRVLLTLGQLNQGNKVLGRAEASFASTSAKWNQALRSKRYRTTTRIPVEGHP